MKDPDIKDMIENGALIVKRDSSESRFFIDFSVMQRKYPEYVEYMVRHTLNDYELSAYESGLIYYTINSAGYLEWRLTRAARQ